MIPPPISGYTVFWSDDFSGSGSPNSANWTFPIPWKNQNGEIQHYTDSTDNCYVKDEQLFICPLKKDDYWTSARMHGNASFQCDPGRKMIVAASIKVGQNSSAQQQGIWPAWWTLGDSFNHGVNWPKCCEWDILELGNGQSWSQATMHQEVNGQPDQQGKQKVDFNRANYHTWAVEVDLTSNEYTEETISWQLDGNTYCVVKCMGDDQLGRECWDRCARSAFFPILNVAVGGNFVGDVGEGTLGGVESGLTVAWVAVYKSE